MIYTDELESYTGLQDMGYQHRRINHLAKVYVDGDTHTNTIEGFFSLLERGISGVYYQVSAKYFQRYLDEQPIFKTMLFRVKDVPAGPPSAGLLETAPA